MRLNAKAILQAVFIIVMIFQTMPVNAQKPLLQERDEVIKAAKNELDSLMRPGGQLSLDAEREKIKGEFIVDLTIYEKGKILSVFMVSSDVDEMSVQNRAKDLIRRIEFGFKVPKSKTYKLQYTFHFK